MKNVKQSWAVIDENGDEFISAKTILYYAGGDVNRAKRVAVKDADIYNDDGYGVFKVKKRDVTTFGPKGGSDD